MLVDFDFDHGIVWTYLTFGNSLCDTFAFTLLTYTNKSLQSINKKDKIPIVLPLQNKLDQSKNKVQERSVIIRIF